MNQEEKIKYLEFIQNVITRMNGNSFQIKNWCIIILSAIFITSISQENRWIILVALFPIGLFWLLDSYYLTQERRFRALYNQVIKAENGLKVFEMDITPFKHGSYSYFTVLRSRTIFSVYLTMAMIVVGIFFILGL